MFDLFFASNVGVKQYWNACVSGSYPVLISTDDILSDIGVTNVTWLIHYSIFLQFKTRFSFRFSTLLDALQMVCGFNFNIYIAWCKTIKYRVKFFKEKCNCKVTILVEENTDVQFLHIIKIMQRMNALLPEGILESVKVCFWITYKYSRNAIIQQCLGLLQYWIIKYALLLV